MVIQNSLKQLMRTPVKTLAFLVLLILAVTFFMLGFQLWTGARDNIERIDKAYTTIGTVEQKATAVETQSDWDAETRSYTFFSKPVYDHIIPTTVLGFEGANYIISPEKRPCYGAYSIDYVIDEDPYLDGRLDSNLFIAEIQPIEDCQTGEPVRMKVLKRLLGGKDYIKEIWFCNHREKQTFPLYASKTYIMALVSYPPHAGYDDYENIPDMYPYSTQYTKDGTRIPDNVTFETPWDEVTDNFYETPRGKRWLALIESDDMLIRTIPVVPTQETKLLMSFFDGDAWIDEGRDISREEYESGEKVCLISKRFARNNNLSVGSSLRLPLRFADYRSPWGISGSLINANGVIYPVFEDSTYTIVGIYETLTDSITEKSVYDMAKNTVVIPSASVKNSDENNIVGMGPMKGYTTSFQIPNGKIHEFMAAWEKQDIANLEINFYDHGYTKIKAGLDDMMNTASVLLISGGVITLLILILFCHLFITKQRKRTAIERSLGMSKNKCIASLLTGILVIVIPACVIGSAISYWLTGYAAEQMTAAHNEQAFDTMYSDWVHGDSTDAQNFEISMDNSLGKAWTGLGVIPVALTIALVNIRGNLKSEPLKLLGEKER